jgi:flagellar assembly protein FliH
VTAHDPQLAALLAGVRPDTVASAPGLARLLSSLMTPARSPDAAPALPTPDMAKLLADARAQALAEGRAEGEAAGRAAAQADLGPLKASLAAAVAATQAATSIDEAALAPLLAGLVKAVATAVLMAELNAGGRVLGPLVAAALAEVADAALPTLCAHPDTLALIGPDLPPGLATAPDPALPPGHIVVAGPDYRVDAGLGERLSRLVEGLACS